MTALIAGAFTSALGVGKAQDRFGRALRRLQRAAVDSPCLYEGQQFGLDREAFRRRSASRDFQSLRKSVNGAVHRIDGVFRGGAQRGEDQPVLGGVGRVGRRLDGPARIERHDRHAVFGERSGLVDAEQGGGAERLRYRGPAHEHVAARQPEGADGEEDRQHHREFFRQQADRERDAGDGALEPVALDEAIGDDHQRAEQQREDAELRHQLAGALLQGARFALNGGERGAEPADRRARAGALDPRHARAAYDHGAGVKERRVIAAGVREGEIRPVAGERFGHRRRLAGQDRLVDDQRVSGEQQRVRGDALALADENDVAGHEIARGNAPFLAVAAHMRRGLGKPLQGLQGALAAQFLKDDEGDGGARAGHHEQALAEIADEQIKRRRRRQQKEHRFLQRAQGDFQDAGRRRFGRGVGAKLRKEPRGVFGSEAVKARLRHANPARKE